MKRKKQGISRKYRMYKLDKDGFTLLTMGFTGKKAMKFKTNYIQAFNSMEKSLTKLASYQESDPIKRAELWIEEQKAHRKALEKKERENKQLASNNALLASQDLEVKTAKEYKYKTQILQNNRGRTINYYVNKYFFEGNYSLAHRKAKALYRSATGINLPDTAKMMSMEQKKDYLIWLSKYDTDEE
jgi:phage regulator Rha-like protein